jgi:hypothetical protein
MNLTRGSTNRDAGSSTYTVPNFREDERTQQQYKASLERRVKAYHAEAEAAVRRTFTAKREALTTELSACELMIENRVKAAQAAMAAYRVRYPHRLVKGKPIKPSFMEWLMSFGAASRLHRAVTDANSAVLEAQTNQRRLAHKNEELDNELGRALAHAQEKAKETTSSPEWLAEIHHDKAFGALKQRVDDIEHERERFAKRLEAGRVSDEELRDRKFAQDDIQPVDVPLTGMMFYRIDVFGNLSYFIIRDLEKKLYALPYDPRLEYIIDGVFDVYRVADGYDVRQRVHEESKLPFTILDHFFICNDRQDIVARAAYREQRAWIKQNRGLPPTPAPREMDRDIIKLLVEFSETIPAPRAPQII